MQPYMKNVSVEYAEKAAPGGEIDKSIKELKEIPVLTNDNAKEVFEKRPKFISYDSRIYSIFYADDENINYVYVDAEGLDIENVVIGSSGSIDIYANVLASKDNVGTKLYRHEVVLNISTSTGSDDLTLEIITTDGVPNTSYSGGPSRFDKTKFSTVVSIYALDYDYFIGTGKYSDDSLIIGLTHFSQSNYPKRVSINTFVSDTVTPL